MGFIFTSSVQQITFFDARCVMDGWAICGGSDLAMRAQKRARRLHSSIQRDIFCAHEVVKQKRIKIPQH